MATTLLFAALRLCEQKKQKKRSGYTQTLAKRIG